MAKVLIAHPSADVYGADLQLLDSITGLIEAGHHVVVTVPSDGPLVGLLHGRGAAVHFIEVPVLRRSALSAKGIAVLGASMAAGTARLTAFLRRLRPDVVYVNTMTIPAWIAAARAARIPVLCHVHEAEDADKPLIRKGLTAPLAAATTIVVNGNAARAAIDGVFPALARRALLIYNGIPNFPADPDFQPAGPQFRLAVVGRLSPRKAPDVALEAIARVRAAGHDVALTVYGTAFDGYEWFAQQLADRAAAPDLAGAVTLAGYVSPVWPALAACDAVLAPSLRESFGNAVVEAQLARRPVIGTASTGHLETISDGETGLLVPPGDPEALAQAIIRLIEDPALARRLADQGRDTARTKFSVDRYRQQIADVVEICLAHHGGHRRGTAAADPLDNDPKR